MEEDQKMTAVDSWDRVMVVVPHQDDEILMAAGIIRHLVNRQRSIDIVMATNGDYGCRDLSVGRARLQETVKGLKLLGVPITGLHILGYADTGMPAEDSFLTHLYEEKDGQKLYPSKCGDHTYGLLEKPELHMEKQGCHAPYCRDSFCQDLKTVLMDKKPSCILTTSPWDIHGDHSGLYRFVCEVLDELKKEEGYEPELYTGLIHSPAGDENWPLRETKIFDCPEGLEEKTSLKWQERIRIPVPEEMLLEKGEKNLKLQALLQYETALEPNAYDFLMSFVKEEEILWKMR